MSSEVQSSLVSVRNLAVRFAVGQRGFLRSKRAWVNAVQGVSFDIARGETLGVVGESGCGKTTLGRAVLQLVRANAGSVKLDGHELTTMWKARWGVERETAALTGLRRRMQMVFQDPYASLDPRMMVGDIVAEPLLIHRLARAQDARDQARALLERVGLDARYAERYPHEFSGGQRQRIGIARALALGPDLIVCDEPISALDVSIQAQILNLLKSLQAAQGLTYLFIAHDIAAVRHMSQRIAVMYLGRIVELGERDDICSRPAHPYTKALLSAVSVADPSVQRARKRLPVLGEPPSPIHPPAGCAFHPRCAEAIARCGVERPDLRRFADGRVVACHLA
jgi:oligopeptide/dipeptide ABC transporter ATP-binding protein